MPKPLTNDCKKFYNKVDKSWGFFVSQTPSPYQGEGVFIWLEIMFDRAKALGLRKQGLTYREIGEQLGVSKQAIHLAIGWHHVKHPSQRKEHAHRRGQLIKKAVLTHYANGKLACVRCGFEDIRALTIDHINGRGAQHRKQLSSSYRGGTGFYRWLIKNDFPPGYQTLCWNCQWIKKAQNAPPIVIDQIFDRA